MSVFGFVPTRDEPAECLPWTRRTGVRLSLPCFGEVGVRSGQQVAQAVRPMIFVSSLEFQVGSCLYVTAAVQAASHFGTAYVAAAAEACSRFIGTCWSLSFSVDPPPLAMFPSPAGLHPVDGITMRAQTILHREILHLYMVC